MAVEETSSLVERTSEGPDCRSTKPQEALLDRCGSERRNRSTGSSSSAWNSCKSILFVALAAGIGLDLGLVRTGGDASDAGIRMLAVGGTASTNNSSALEAYLLTANKAQHMGVELCDTPYITKDIDILRAMERRQMSWLHGLVDMAKARQANPGRGWDTFNDTMMPVLHEACATERVGSDGDGGKFVCGLEDIARRKDCVVYSIGSNNQWDFEEAIVTRTGCHVETFDCTVQHADIPPSIQDHVHFEPLCLGTVLQAGARAPKDPSPGMDLTTLKALRNTSNISLLKMDIEGAEWGALRAMLRRDWEALPEQISMELHNWAVEPMEVAMFAQQLHMAGYRVVSKEDNPKTDTCTEFTLVRVYCPRTNPFNSHVHV